MKIDETIWVLKKTLQYVRLTRRKDGWEVQLGAHPEARGQAFFSGETQLFATISAAAKWVFLRDHTCRDADDYRHLTGRAVPGVSWRYFGLKTNPMGRSRKKPKTVAGKKAAHIKKLKAALAGTLAPKQLISMLTTTASTSPPAPTSFDLTGYSTLSWSKTALAVPTVVGTKLFWRNRDGAYQAILRANGSWDVTQPDGMHIIEFHSDLISKYLCHAQLRQVFILLGKSTNHKSKAAKARKAKRS